MNRRQKIIATGLWILLLSCTLVLVAVWSGARLNLIPRYAQGGSASEALLFPVPAFDLTDQESRPVTLETLKGRPWIGAFIFTRCPGPCPVMTRNMAVMQEKLPADVRLVSFTLDAEYDTADVLKAYGAKYGADGSRWHFLTGPQETINQIADEMKIAAQRGKDPIDIQHGTHFVLVNADGKVHNYYRHDDADSQALLVKDATALAGR